MRAKQMVLSMSDFRLTLLHRIGTGTHIHNVPGHIDENGYK